MGRTKQTSATSDKRSNSEFQSLFCSSPSLPCPSHLYICFVCSLEMSRYVYQFKWTVILTALCKQFICFLSWTNNWFCSGGRQFICLLSWTNNCFCFVYISNGMQATFVISNPALHANTFALISCVLSMCAYRPKYPVFLSIIRAPNCYVFPIGSSR